MCWNHVVFVAISTTTATSATIAAITIQKIGLPEDQIVQYPVDR